MEDLPKELIIAIVSFLEPNFIMRTCWLTCKSLRDTILVDSNNCKALWRAWLRQHQPEALHELPPASMVSKLPNATLVMLISQHVPKGWKEYTLTPGFGYNGSTGAKVEDSGLMELQYAWGDPHGVAGRTVSLQIPLKSRLKAICVLNRRETVFWALDQRSILACYSALQHQRRNNIRDIATTLRDYNVSHSFSDFYEENWTDPPTVEEWTVESSQEDEEFAALLNSMQKTTL